MVSRRMLQETPEPSGASFETPLSRLLRMRADNSKSGSRPARSRPLRESAPMTSPETAYPEANYPEALALPAENPFAARWETPFRLPPFAAIKPEHIRPAFDAALAKHKAEIAAIVADKAAPDFANTIEALERAGRALSRVGGVFYNLTGADTNEALQAIEREMSPITSRHWSAIMMDEGLFAR